MLPWLHSIGRLAKLEKLTLKLDTNECICHETLQLNSECKWLTRN